VGETQIFVFLCRYRVPDPLPPHISFRCRKMESILEAWPLPDENLRLLLAAAPVPAPLSRT
jgi:hypothetical protein